jgi:hypothetical protein
LIAVRVIAARENPVLRAFMPFAERSRRSHTAAVGFITQPQEADDIGQDRADVAVARELCAMPLADACAKFCAQGQIAVAGAIRPHGTARR